MVAYASLFITVLFAGYVSARPTPDSASGGEVAVSAPFGVILSDTAELSSQLASESVAAASASWRAASTTSPSSGHAVTSSPYASPAAWSHSWNSSAVSSAAHTMMTESPHWSSVSYATASSDNQLSSSKKSTAAATPSNVWSSAAPSSSATSSAWHPAITQSYGSGSSNWGGSGYDYCVEQCIASFGTGSAMTTATPPPSATAASATASGSTITVIVAPTQGVLRYVPFVVNASVGDTIKYVWNANNHTVTKSSQLAICNKTADAPFASGEQNMGFTFTQVVNDTQPTFFYCGTPGHCEKGMFGILNPPSLYNANTSVSTMMSAMAANDSSMAAMNAYTNQMTSGNAQAAGWGSNIDLASMPEWSYSYVMENVMYTRIFLAANPSVMQPDGSIDLSAGSALSSPKDVTSAIAGNTTSAAASSATASSAAGSAAPATSNVANSAASTAVSSGVLAIAAVAAAFLAL